MANGKIKYLGTKKLNIDFVTLSQHSKRQKKQALSFSKEAEEKFLQIDKSQHSEIRAIIKSKILNSTSTLTSSLRKVSLEDVTFAIFKLSKKTKNIELLKKKKS